MTPDTPPARQQVDEALLERVRAFLHGRMYYGPGDITAFCADFAASETAALAKERDELQFSLDAVKVGLATAQRISEGRLATLNEKAAEAKREWVRAEQAESSLSRAEALLRRCSELSTECHPSGALCDDIAAFLTPAAPGAWGPRVGDVVTVAEPNGWHPDWRGAVGTVTHEYVQGSLSNKCGLKVVYAPNNKNCGLPVMLPLGSTGIAQPALLPATPQERAAAGLPVEVEPDAETSPVFAVWAREVADLKAKLAEARKESDALASAIAQDSYAAGFGETMTPAARVRLMREEIQRLRNVSYVRARNATLSSPAAASEARPTSDEDDPVAAGIRYAHETMGTREVPFDAAHRTDKWYGLRDAYAAGRRSATPPVSDAGEIGAKDALRGALRGLGMTTLWAHDFVDALDAYLLARSPATEKGGA